MRAQVDQTLTALFHIAQSQTKQMYALIILAEYKH